MSFAKAIGKVISEIPFSEYNPKFRKAQSRVWVSFFRQFTLLNMVGQYHKRWQKNLFNRAGWEACYAYSLPMLQAGGCLSLR